MFPKIKAFSIPSLSTGRLFCTFIILAVLVLWAGPLNLYALIKGDINTDGQIDITDTIKALRMYIGPDTPDLPKGDVNYDSLINQTDADLILQTALGLATLPPDPGAVAPSVDRTVAGNINTATEFLYTGTNPIQTGVVPGTIDPKRTAVIRGNVLTRDGLALEGVVISILDHPEFGRTLSRADGMFDLAVNGGGNLTVKYQKSGYLEGQRQVKVPWQDFVWAPDLAMVPIDPQVTTINLNAPVPFQVAKGSMVSDADGIRQVAILVPQGTQAQLVMPDGSNRSISTLNIRATEYTVGPNGF